MSNTLGGVAPPIAAHRLKRLQHLALSILHEYPGLVEKSSAIRASVVWACAAADRIARGLAAGPA